MNGKGKNFEKESLNKPEMIFQEGSCASILGK